MGARPARSEPPADRSEHGSALVVTMLASSAAALLGMGILVLSEAEQLQSKAWAERVRARAAAEGTVGVAASWFADPLGAVALPDASEWELGYRRGDLDGDGRVDAACDGSEPEGRWSGYPLVPPEADPDLAGVFSRACGEASAPDLVIERGPTLLRLGALAGEGVVIERIKVYAGPAIRGSRSSLTVEVTACVFRGTLRVGRTTVLGQVRALPRLRGDEVLAAGGHVLMAAGAGASWGDVTAGGDVVLPAWRDLAFPHAGLPRTGDGAPLRYAGGGATDWNRETLEREYVMTELIGRTVQGSPVSGARLDPPELADPWLRIRAGGVVRAGERPVGAPGARQPIPYDPRATTVEDDLSFILQGTGPGDPGCGGRAEELAGAVAAASAPTSVVRRFVLDPSARGEPRWKERGRGPSRTAAEWLADSLARPVVASFVAGDAPLPEVVTIPEARGIVIVEAAEVVLRPKGEARLVALNMPGEPFVDFGIDADHDGVPDDATVGNGAWDADLDDDAQPDPGPPDGWGMTSILPKVWEVPNGDRDPATLDSHPHEAFLNLEYPKDGRPGPVRVRFRHEADADPAPVRDTDGDGIIRAGLDRVTTLACDAEGALVEVPVHVHALVVNPAGGVTLAAGCRLAGAVRARGDVTLGPEAHAWFDARLAREGFLSLDLPRGVLASLASPQAGVRPHAPSSAPQPGEGEAGAPDGPEPQEPGDAPDPGPRGGHDGPGRGGAPGGGRGTGGGPEPGKSGDAPRTGTR